LVDREQSFRRSFDFENDHWLAPMLASSLARVSRCRQVLQESPLTKQSVLRAQDDAGGSRYELGLGLDVEPLSEADLTALRDALLAEDRPEAEDKEVEGLLRRIADQPVPEPADDPDGTWFYRACGLRTVHRLGAGSLYLSHLPTRGMAIAGASSLASGSTDSFGARFHAPEDPGPNAVLLAAGEKAAELWSDAGQADWMIIANRHDAWSAAEHNADAAGIFQAAGLSAFEPPEEMAERLDRVPSEMLVVLELDEELANAVTAGEEGSADTLQTLENVLAEAGFVAALPFVTDDGRLLVTAAVIGLPSVGSNLAPRRAVGFRWYTVPIQGDAGKISSIGSRVNYQTRQAPALTALVAVGYTRNPELTDPYEYQVRLPEEALLDLRQYEFLMNVLAHTHPLGVEVNTWQLRQRHVDLDGDAQADALNPDLSRTFRRFRRPRHRGESAVGLEG